MAHTSVKGVPDSAVRDTKAEAWALKRETELRSIATGQGSKTHTVGDVLANIAKSVLGMRGRTDIAAEKTVKQEANREFLVESVKHTYAGRNWETSVELNAGNKGKAKSGHGKKPGKKINLVVPAPG
ncbi:hypothetical protein [Burkholderia ubonensis]|uniref:hypothetical protein n=1 Tax=Burkholderia ubonensis TaxID=101571 RepID=UPI00075F2A28|nr:hypothetical protein WK00_21150 [Burkholderia ubonensis]